MGLDNEIDYERIKEHTSVDLNEKFLKTYENKISLLDQVLKYLIRRPSPKNCYCKEYLL